MRKKGGIGSPLDKLLKAARAVGREIKLELV